MRRMSTRFRAQSTHRFMSTDRILSHVLPLACTALLIAAALIAPAHAEGAKTGSSSNGLSEHDETNAGADSELLHVDDARRRAVGTVGEIAGTSTDRAVE